MKYEVKFVTGTEDIWEERRYTSIIPELVTGLM
jgi:hypothetical protein